LGDAGEIEEQLHQLSVEAYPTTSRVPARTHALATLFVRNTQTMRPMMTSADARLGLVLRLAERPGVWRAYVQDSVVEVDVVSVEGEGFVLRMPVTMRTRTVRHD
jgi:hypothetical protein